MTAAQIRENILEQSDEALLSSLPISTRLACQVCGSVSAAKRAHSEKTKTYYCPICKDDKPVHEVKYYTKNKTADPVKAVTRHREFWQRIYYEQLNRESNPTTFRNSLNAAGDLYNVTADIKGFVESDVVKEDILQNSTIHFIAR